MNADPRRLPTRKAISEHWADWLVAIGKFDSRFEVMDCADICWACGFDWHEALDRAHILARSCGGSDDASNLHLLDPICHRDSEHLSDTAYFAWFKSRTVVDRAALTFMRSGGSLTRLVAA